MQIDYHEVLHQQSDGFLTLSLNRPVKRNAMTTRTVAELLHALEQCAGDASIRVVVLRGAGFLPVSKYLYQRRTPRHDKFQKISV